MKCAREIFRITFVCCNRMARWELSFCATAISIRKLRMEGFGNHFSTMSKASSNAEPNMYRFKESSCQRKVKKSEKIHYSWLNFDNIYNFLLVLLWLLLHTMAATIVSSDRVNRIRRERERDKTQRRAPRAKKKNVDQIYVGIGLFGFQKKIFNELCTYIEYQ